MKARFWFGLLMAAFTIAVIAVLLYFYHKPVVTITEEPVFVESSGFHPTNNVQFWDSTVWMEAYHGKLFFYRQTDYEPGMYVFENGGVTKIFSGVEGEYVRSFRFHSFGDYVYYQKNLKRAPAEYDTFCFSFDTREETKITDEHIGLYQAIYNMEDSSMGMDLASSVYPDHNEYLFFHGDKQINRMKNVPLATIGKYQYMVSDFAGNRLMQTDETGETKEVPFRVADCRFYFPLEDGILVYNVGYNELLYWIDEDGNVKLLFDAGYFRTYSTIAMCGTDIYLSVYGYGAWDKWDRPMPAEDTDGNGIFRISLEDQSVEKICDRYYTGLFNFDDTCLYACDGYGGIYQLDFDGNEIRTLLSIEKR